MNRRGFLGVILSAACAPAIVRADSLMRIVARDTTIISDPLVSYSEHWYINQMRDIRASAASPERCLADLHRYFADRFDALWAEAYSGALLTGRLDCDPILGALHLAGGKP